MEEKYTFQEIIDMMEQAESYDDLYLAVDLIVDPGVKEAVLQDISQCESDNDEVEVAYSVVTSDILDTLAMMGDKNVLESTTDKYKDLPQEEIYELISNRMFQGMDIEKTIDETVSAIMNDYAEDYTEDLIREYVRSKASEIYADELCENKKLKTESMNGFNSKNSVAQQLFDDFEEFENIDTNKWNASTSDARIKMVRPQVIKFYKQNRAKIDDNWEDFMELLEYWNYHTEYKIFNELSNDEILNVNESNQLKTESKKVTLDDIYHKADDLGYTVQYDDRDPYSLVIWNPESEENEDFYSFDNSKLFEYLDSIPAVRYQTDDADISTLIVWLKGYGESKQKEYFNNTNKDKIRKSESMDWLNADKTYRYQLLDRLRQDCDYYLGNGNRYAKHLWAGNEQGQIEMMRKLWNSFSAEDKPEWLTMEQINDYAKQMGVKDLPSTTNGTAKKEIQNMLDRAEKRSKEIVDESFEEPGLEITVSRAFNKANGKVPEEIEFNNKVYKCTNVMDANLAPNVGEVVYYTGSDVNSSDDYFYVTYTLNKVGENSYKGVENVIDVIDCTNGNPAVTENKEIKTEYANLFGIAEDMYNKNHKEKWHTLTNDEQARYYNRNYKRIKKLADEMEDKSIKTESVDNTNKVVDALKQLNVSTFQELRDEIDRLLEEEIINEQYEDFLDIISNNEEKCMDYIDRRSKVTNTDWKDEAYIESDYLVDTISQLIQEASLEESKEIEPGKEKLVEDSDNGTIHSDLGYFYIGDPCYVLSEEDYHDVWGFDNNFNDGTISVDEKYSFIVHGTAYGDGEYEDQYGHSYGVDSGTLAVIPMELVSKTAGIKYGATFKSNSATLDYYDDGVFTIGLDDKNVVIPTGDIEDDYEKDGEYMDEEYIEESKHTRNQNYKSNYTDGESIVIDSVKDGVVSWHYDFEEDGADGPFESDIYDNTKFKDDEGYEWDLKKDFGYVVNEGIKDNNYKDEDTLKAFVKLKQAILKEKQFNKKVDLNQQLNSFMNKNNITVKDNKQSWYGIKDDEVVYDVFSGDKLIGIIGVGKNNIEVLQKDSDKLTESSEDNTYYYELHFDFTEISGKDSDGYSIFFKSNELVDDDVEEIWNLAVRENKIDEYDDFEDVDYAQQIDKDEYESAIGTKTTKECKLLEMIDDNLDLSEQLLTIVGIKGSPETIDSLLQKISNSSEPYITSDWIYDEVRIKNKPYNEEEAEEFETEDVFLISDISDKDIYYLLDPTDIYHKTITIQDRTFDLMFRVIDYYGCVIQIYDIVEE